MDDALTIVGLGLALFLLACLYVAGMGPISDTRDTDPDEDEDEAPDDEDTD